MPRPTWSTDPVPAIGNLQRADAPDGLAVSQMFGVLRRSWAWVLVPTLAAGVAAGVFVQVATPRYTGEAKLILESRDPSFARTAAERAEQAQPIDEQAVASQVQVVMSRDLAREAIRRLKLVGNPEFDPSAVGAGPVQRTLMLLGLAKAPFETVPEDRVLDAYLERLLVFPVGKSRILQVEFRSRDPQLAAAGANTVADLYIASLGAASVDTARYASSWLGTNIGALRKRVAEADAEVEAYRARHGLLGSGAANTPLSSQQLGELSSQLSQARTVKADVSARAKLLKEMIKEGRAFEIPDVANNELIRRTVESRMSLRAQLAMESRTLLPAHPRIKELTAQVNDLETQIKAAAERVVRTLENDARIAGARVESLQAAVDGQQAVVVAGNSSGIELRSLEREAKVQREQLESYLARYREAAARDAENATPADARVVSRAIVPDLPSFPKKLPIVAFVTVLAMLLSAAGVLARHLLATPASARRSGGNKAPRREDPPFEGASVEEVRPAHPPIPDLYPEARPASASVQADSATPITAAVTPAPAEREAPPTPLAGTVPVHPESSARVVSATTVPGPYDLGLLIDRLDLAPSRGGRCVLVAEGASPRAGSRLADSLARTLALRARTVCIDVNGAGDGPDVPGLTDLVAGEADFIDVIQPVRGTRLHRVGGGSIETDLLVEEPQGLAIGLQVLAEAYDWVVCRIDLSAGPAVHELYATLAGCTDCVVIASEAPVADPDLITLHGLAHEAGTEQVLVARASTIMARRSAVPEPELRLSA